MIKGFVYFIQSNGVNGPIKIGFSRDPDTRVKALQTGSGYPVHKIAVLPATSAHERHLHRALSKHRLNGEWFDNCDDVRNAISSAVAGDWLGYSAPKPKIKAQFAQEARDLANFIKSVAEFSGVWSLKSRKDTSVFGISTWIVWKFTYRVVEPKMGELESLIKAKHLAAKHLMAVAVDELEDAQNRISIMEEDTTFDRVSLQNLEDIEKRLAAALAERGIVHVPVISTPEEDAEFRKKFEADVAAKIEARRTRLLRKPKIDEVA